MSYHKAKASLERAREIEQSSSSVMLAFKRDLAAALSKIDLDRRLTEEGKQEAKAEVRQKHAIEFLQKSHTMKQEYVANIRKAIREAEKVLYAPPRKPDATKLGRFEDALRSLKTELMFATSQRSALEKLRGFIDKLDDPYLAKRVRDDFADIAPKLLAAPGDGTIAKGDIKVSVRAELGEMYDNLLKPYQTEDFRGAGEVLEIAQMLAEDSRIHRSPIVNDAAKEAFGEEYARYINDTESFFAEHPEHTPEPFIDEEGELARQTAEDIAWIYKDDENPTLNVGAGGGDAE
ncbi:hypothetical protein POTG_02076 [Paenibacillus sp. oral taxon 786 str. D14]|uniref:hypothetical protein n=1 Tax=Paenibacillus sp. oral taxon 786 TaxID=652715 RepID=UPI0001AFCEC9|nr:hypothetical protein [Paenibacillus sp. oral taxon 786]EES73324.1 hypothetical protein POTG_02076 [Paenibacillus sp. oral taxon 786 str. D14]